jgi:hypothetical protein
LQSASTRPTWVSPFQASANSIPFHPRARHRQETLQTDLERKYVSFNQGGANRIYGNQTAFTHTKERGKPGHPHPLCPKSWVLMDTRAETAALDKDPGNTRPMANAGAVMGWRTAVLSRELGARIRSVVLWFIRTLVAEPCCLLCLLLFKVHLLLK